MQIASGMTWPKERKTTPGWENGISPGPFTQERIKPFPSRTPQQILDAMAASIPAKPQGMGRKRRYTGGCACEHKGTGCHYFTTHSGKHKRKVHFKRGEGYVHHRHSRQVGCDDNKHHVGQAGDGYWEDLKALGKKAVGKVGEAVATVAKWIAPSDMSTKAKRIMSEIKNLTIEGITVCRVPITPLVEAALRKIATVPAQYDKIYHLYMVITLSGGKSVRIERNQNFELGYATPADLSPKDTSDQLPDGVQGVACTKVPIPKGWNMGEAMTKFIAQAKVDNPEYGPWRYAALSPENGKHNNCQDFVTSWLTAMGALTPSLSKFINQDIDKLLGVAATKGTQAITDIAGAVGTALGRGRTLHHIMLA